MKFYFEEQPLNQSQVVLHSDYSFGTINNEFWDFQISIEPYPVLLLNFNYKDKKCDGIEGFLHLDKCRKKDIQFDVIKKGVLKVDLFPVEQDAYGMTYNLENAKFYYDYKNKILAVGEINLKNEVFEIGLGQYVKLKDGKIVLLLIQF